MNTIFLKDGEGGIKIGLFVSGDGMQFILNIKQQPEYFLQRVEHTTHLSPSVHCLLQSWSSLCAILHAHFSQHHASHSASDWTSKYVRERQHGGFVRQHSPTKVSSYKPNAGMQVDLFTPACTVVEHCASWWYQTYLGGRVAIMFWIAVCVLHYIIKT